MSSAPRRSPSDLLANVLCDVDVSTPKYIVFPIINLTDNDDSTQNNNNATSNTPSIGSRFMLCKINVKGFDAEDLNVALENGFLVIKGNHGEKRYKYGLVSRMFTSRVAISRDIEEKDILIYFSSDGILSVYAQLQRPILITSNMSSPSPSTSILPKYVVEEISVFVPQVIRSQNSAPPMNLMQTNLTTQNNNNAAATAPENSRIRILALGVKNLRDLKVKVLNESIMVRGVYREKRNRVGLAPKIFSRRIAIPTNMVKETIRSYINHNDQLIITGKKKCDAFDVPIITDNQPAGQPMNQL